MGFELSREPCDIFQSERRTFRWQMMVVDLLESFC